MKCEHCQIHKIQHFNCKLTKEAVSTSSQAASVNWARNWHILRITLCTKIQRNVLKFHANISLPGVK